MTTILFYAAVLMVGALVALVGLVVTVGLLAYFMEAKGFIKNEGPAGGSNP
jgi:hypothetical protein